MPESRVTQSLGGGLGAQPCIPDGRPQGHHKANVHGRRAFTRDPPGQGAPSNAEGGVQTARGTEAHPGVQRRLRGQLEWWPSSTPFCGRWLTPAQSQPQGQSEAWLLDGGGGHRAGALSQKPALDGGLGDLPAPSSLECSRMTQNFSERAEGPWTGGPIQEPGDQTSK